MKLLWLDLETTGLSAKDGRILEVGAIVTTGRNLVRLGTFNEVIFYPFTEILPMMDKWCVDTHSSSGLLESVAQSSLNLKNVEERLMSFIKDNFPDPKDKSVLAGSSVHFDRDFIKVYFPEVDKLLHYRHMDVSALKIAFELMFNVKLPKNPNRAAHRSIDDLENTIFELRTLFGVSDRSPL